MSYSGSEEGRIVVTATNKSKITEAKLNLNQWEATRMGVCTSTLCPEFKTGHKGHWL